jgi:hypothetical protein
MFFSENSLTGSVPARFMHVVTHSSLAEPSINDQSSGACIATVLIRVNIATETSQSLLGELISVSKKLSGDCSLCVKFAKIRTMTSFGAPANGVSAFLCFLRAISCSFSSYESSPAESFSSAIRASKAAIDMRVRGRKVRGQPMCGVQWALIFDV